MFKLKKKFFKIASLNLIVLITLILAPLIAVELYLKFRLFTRKFDNSGISSVSYRANYPTYDDLNYSRKIFEELQISSTYKYYAFIGWRRELINLENTNVTGKYNTRLSTGQKLGNSTWFFGGSIMCGNGVSD